MQLLRTSKLSVAAGLSLALLAAACSSSSSSPKGSTGTTVRGASHGDTASLTIGSPSGTRGFDPYKCAYGPEQNILLAGYDTLIRAAADGSYQPSLATSWKYTTPTEFTLTLRSDVTFDDGTPIDAKVVVANLTRAARTLAAITAAFALGTKSITAVGTNQVTIALSSPNPDLANILSTCAGMIINPKLLAKPDDMANKMDGSGPYTYDNGASITGSTYVFHRKAKYWNASAYPFKKVTFRVIPDFNAAFNAIRSGQIDFAVGTPAEQPDAKSAGLGSVQGNINFFAIDLRDRQGTVVPALKDVRVRQALNYAIDRAAIIKTFFEGAGRPTDQMLSPDAKGYDTTLDASYAYDVNKAKDLLKQAGFANGFSISVLSTQSFQLDQVLQAVSGYWAKIGVKVKDDVQPVATWSTLLISNKYPAVIFPFFGLPQYTAMWQSFAEANPLNPFHTPNASLGVELGKAAIAPDESTRAPSITNAQKILIDQAWYAGVGYDTVIWFYNPKKVSAIKMQRSQSMPHFYDWQAGT